MADTVRSFSAMLRDALGSLIASDAESYLDMLADDAVMEFPFAPPGYVHRLDGKAAVASYLQELADTITIDRMGDYTVLSGDGDLTVLEFTAFGHGTRTDEPYDQRYISVIRTADGRIVHYRDYWNPLVLLGAIKGRAAVEALADNEGAPA